MNTSLLFIGIVLIAILIGFTYFTFLSKTSPKKGKTKIKWKIIICKIFQIEFESEHEDNFKK